MYKRKRGEKMSPRTGRPTNDPKKNRVDLRLSDKDIEILEYCCKQTGLSKADIIRKGLYEVYQQIKK